MSVTAACAGSNDPNVAAIVAVPGVTEVTIPEESTTATFVFDDENPTPERIGAVLPSVNVAVTARGCVLPVPLRVIAPGERAMLTIDLTNNCSVACATFPAPSVAIAINWCVPLLNEVVSRVA
jgi:hypothetical protein